ncbi:biliverdin-producing heme oxygenase [Novosphingobium resinovorum]|uniref:biliverdin-producing heme oxygenase n=1 Tax=Novosphingobium resinovorum TaxID=158500 RepID=UPI002ED0B8E6|nr:biliverdin-producing heme oxygenase [Novosphingobium resinovorum]
MPDLLSTLREATGPAHESLDASFGSLDLDKRGDLARFLAAHAIGLAPLFGTFSRFVQDRLGLDCPDYPAMLRGDLDRLGVGALPEIEGAEPSADGDGADAGTSYVICGSRLGLAMIRQKGYWGEAQGFRSAYMSDGRGHDAWKALVPVLRTGTYSAGQALAARTAALAAFETFSRAFAASARVQVRSDG